MKFILKNTYNSARLGEIITAHGKIQTPVFMPVGTIGTVKAMMPESIKATGAEIILGNTYHLMLKPGAELVEKLGGLHKFANWDRPILTDSGGFQVWSLSKLRKIIEEGVMFRSHIDGSKHMLTPESATDIQYKLGSDISMVLDECTDYPISHKYAEKSMELTSRWAKRSRDAFKNRDGYGQFGIVQGSVYEDLRKRSAQYLTSLNFEGYAIGGIAVQASQELMFTMIDNSCEYLPENKPRYLMGVGTPSDIIGAVKRGVDMFDCVLPTRAARHGKIYTKYGEVNIYNAKYTEDNTPLEDDCICPACISYTKAYLRHLMTSREILGSMLLTWHNLHYFQDLMKRIRGCITNKKEIYFDR